MKKMITAIVDIETDALDATLIHCIVARNYSDGKEKVWVGDECKEFASWSKRIDKFIMHNGVSFDAPILNRLTGSNIKVNQVRDTLIESQLYNPIRDGGHSLASWGERLRFPKGDFNTFNMYTPDMLEYCRQDVRLTHKVAQELEKEGKQFSTKSYDLELKVRAIVDQQEKNGFTFNLREAMSFLAILEEEQQSLEDKAQEMFEPVEVQLKTKVKYIPFNIASRKQIAERLMERGWKPKKFTDKGNIIVSEEILNTLKMPEAKMFSRYFLLQKRTGLVRAWIEACQDDGRVRGRVMTLRTITGRMAHNSPNMAQVPASYSPYGKECRALWTVSNLDTHTLIGTDASGLELRCLAHYMNDSAFTHEVVNGDVHTANMKAAGLTDRDQAKTFIYAFLYGAGPAKIGKVVGGSAKAGQQLITKFLFNMPKLKELRENVVEASQIGTILALDGRLLHIRADYASLNTLLQGAGAIICKQWLVHITERIRKSGVDAKLVASIHDEYQFEVAKKDAIKFGQITKDAMKETEKTLNVKCPLDCDFKIGTTWSETH
jgi:DNA polymerase I-like protein with 3'-5' exonuclease and polymerase domains